MIKLYVDDLRACPEGWTLARTITQAIRILATQEVSEVSLDHDIMHTIVPCEDIIPIPQEVTIHDMDRVMKYAGKGIDIPVACPENFSAVAYYIAAMPKDRKPKVSIHTANPAGRYNMERILKEDI